MCHVPMGTCVCSTEPSSPPWGQPAPMCHGCQWHRIGHTAVPPCRVTTTCLASLCHSGVQQGRMWPLVSASQCAGEGGCRCPGGVSDGPCWSHYISFSLVLSVDMRDRQGFSGHSHCVAAFPDGWQGGRGLLHCWWRGQWRGTGPLACGCATVGDVPARARGGGRAPSPHRCSAKRDCGQPSIWCIPGPAAALPAGAGGCLHCEEQGSEPGLPCHPCHPDLLQVQWRVGTPR